MAASDSTGRPLVVPQAGNPQNAVATLGAVASEQVVGQMHGLPVITDPSIPTNLGTGTDEDVIHVLRASDILLYESGIRSRVLPEVGSGNLTVRLQVYGYLDLAKREQNDKTAETRGTDSVLLTEALRFSGNDGVERNLPAALTVPGVPRLGLAMGVVTTPRKRCERLLLIRGARADRARQNDGERRSGPRTYADLKGRLCREKCVGKARAVG